MRASPFFAVLMGDSKSYDEWARRIAGGEWIGREVFYQAPLYPYFLGVVYAIGGHHLVVVRVLQAILGSLACVFLALAGERFFSRRVGLMAGLALALYAPAIFFDGLIQKSTLDVFFICLALWLLSRVVVVRPKADTTTDQTRVRRKATATDQATVRRQASTATDHPMSARERGSQSVRSVRLQPDLPAWLWLGVAIGALTLTRENAIVFTAVIVVWAAFTRQDRVRTIGAFVLGVAIVVLPVAIRNSLVGGG